MSLNTFKIEKPSVTVSYKDRNVSVTPTVANIIGLSKGQMIDLHTRIHIASLHNTVNWLRVKFDCWNREARLHDSIDLDDEMWQAEMVKIDQLNDKVDALIETHHNSVAKTMLTQDEVDALIESAKLKKG